MSTLGSAQVPLEVSVPSSIPES
ncbi:MAG: hypothetical protein QOD84_950, partial [Acidobacteriaceae bacterium]